MLTIGKTQVHVSSLTQKDKGAIRKQVTTYREFFFARGMNDANLSTALFYQANTNLHKKENQLGKQYILGS